MQKRTFSTWYLDFKQYDSYVYMENLFSAEECDAIIQAGENNLRLPGTIVSENVDYNESIRKNSVSWFDSGDPNNAWFFEKCTDAVLALNEQFYKFDLDYIESLQYTIYDQIGDHYSDHIDALPNSIHYRKLSFSIQLDDPSNYGGSDLIVKTGSGDIEKSKVKRSRGCINVFPSYVLHQVTPLTFGKRRSLVGWVCGPRFR